ncbi:MAG: UvrD-helicase domain-containing protein, partial [Marmoricola sp.]
MTGTAVDFAAFNVLDDLPARCTTTLLEASAGTGKTWTIGALVTRYIVEGHASPEELLVVTFGRAATRELRQRVREQLTAAYQTLRDRTVAPEPSDRLLACLLKAPEAELAERERRARAALANYDASTIVTTHEFCSLVLRSLGVAGDFDAGARLVENLDDLVEEVVADLFLQRFGGSTQAPFKARDASRLGHYAVENALAELTPDDGGRTIAGERRDFAQAVRAEVDRRKRKRGLLSYDDLLSRLADALRAADSPAAQRMRERWKFVLVDEFQDTDGVQWDVLDRAFSGHATMVLIGDPKQAIYGFRGGDIPTYLKAAEAAAERRTLATNYRSDGPLVEALQALLGGAALGDDEIRVHPVTARGAEPQVTGLPADDPVRLRQVLAEPTMGDGGMKLAADDARKAIATDLAADIAVTLQSGARYRGVEGERPLEPGDLAVLMFSLSQADLVRSALAEHGITSVVASSASVMGTQGAADWLVLLDALNQPQRTPLLRAVALSPFIGMTPEDLDRLGDDATELAADKVRGWLELARRFGIASVHEAVLAEGLAERMLSRADGERRFTDLHHVGQVLHEAAQADGLGLAALAQWLRVERRLAKRSSERARRLDTDSDAVQILTIHGSKGLQFPVVYLPFAFNRWISDDRDMLVYHRDGVRCADVGGAPAPEVMRASLREDAAEELRLTYVALTRAQSQVVLWWAPTRDAANGGISRLLLGRSAGASEVPDSVAVPTDAEAREIYRRWEAAGALRLEVAEPQRVIGQVPTEAKPPVAARLFTRQLDHDWRRTSYSGLIRVDEAHATSEPEVIGIVDEGADGDEAEAPAGVVPAEPAPGSAAVVSPMATLPAGATFGSLVHAVLETADPQAADLRAELTQHATDHLAWWSVDASADEVADALLEVHRTPLGPLAENLTLADFGRPDRLCELDFEIPLAAGDQADPFHDVLLRQVAALMRRHLPADDPLRPYADRLESPELGAQVLRGYLSGSIDVVLRVRSAEGEARYVVVDYKTNLLPTQGEQATAWDYRPQALAEAMVHSHYPLQAMLYSAVLHRFLRWRIPDYRPERDLGGVMYLYLRGMCGASTPLFDANPAGVFSWRPPV